MSDGGIDMPGMEYVSPDQIAADFAEQESMAQAMLTDLDGEAAHASDSIDRQIRSRVSVLEDAQTVAASEIERMVYEPICALDNSCISANDFVGSVNQPRTSPPQSSPLAAASEAQWSQPTESAGGLCVLREDALGFIPGAGYTGYLERHTVAPGPGNEAGWYLYWSDGAYHRYMRCEGPTDPPRVFIWLYKTVATRHQGFGCNFENCVVNTWPGYYIPYLNSRHYAPTAPPSGPGYSVPLWPVVPPCAVAAITPQSPDGVTPAYPQPAYPAPGPPPFQPGVDRPPVHQPPGAAVPAPAPAPTPPGRPAPPAPPYHPPPPAPAPGCPPPQTLQCPQCNCSVTIPPIQVNVDHAPAQVSLGDGYITQTEYPVSLSNWAWIKGHEWGRPWLVRALVTYPPEVGLALGKATAKEAVMFVWDMAPSTPDGSKLPGPGEM